MSSKKKVSKKSICFKNMGKIIKYLGEKFKVHPDLFVVGDEGKDQANQGELIFE